MFSYAALLNPCLPAQCPIWRTSSHTTWHPAMPNRATGWRVVGGCGSARGAVSGGGQIGPHHCQPPLLTDSSTSNLEVLKFGALPRLLVPGVRGAEFHCTWHWPSSRGWLGLAGGGQGWYLAHHQSNPNCPGSWDVPGTPTAPSQSRCRHFRWVIVHLRNPHRDWSPPSHKTSKWNDWGWVGANRHMDLLGLG